MGALLALFARARRYAELSPVERALLRLIEGLVCAGLVGAATACAQYLASAPHAAALDWPVILRVCAAAAAVAVLMALGKYARAHGDPTLGAAIETVGQRVAQAGGAGAGATAAPGATLPPT